MAAMAAVNGLVPVRFRAKSRQFKWFQELSPERQGQNLALTVWGVPYSIDSGRPDGQHLTFQSPCAPTADTSGTTPLFTKT